MSDDALQKLFHDSTVPWCSMSTVVYGSFPHNTTYSDNGSRSWTCATVSNPQEEASSHISIQIIDRSHQNVRNELNRHSDGGESRNTDKLCQEGISKGMQHTTKNTLEHHNRPTSDEERVQIRISSRTDIPLVC